MFSHDSDVMRNLDNDDDDLLDSDGLVRSQRARVLRAENNATCAPTELATLQDRIIW